MRKFYFGSPVFFYMAPDDQAAAGGAAGASGDAGTDADDGAGDAPLFQDDVAGGDDMTAMVGKLAAMSPEDLASFAATMPPEAKVSLASALLAGMTPEERAMVDGTQAGDVAANMATAQADDPNATMQMSILKRCKEVQKQPGMQALLQSEVDKLTARIGALHEAGYLDEKEQEAMLGRLNNDKTVDRFSILLTDKKGKITATPELAEVLKEVELLERMQNKGKGILGVNHLRMGALPVPKPKDKDSQQFDTKKAEEAGSRLAAKTW